MFKLTRRTLLAGTGAAAVAASLPRAGYGPALAKAPLATSQNAGWYRYKVGDFEVTVATDGVNRMKLPPGFVSNKSVEDVNAGLASAFLQPAPDTVAVPYTPIAINTGSKLIVMDTGTGEANLVASKGAAGQFNTNLKTSGIDRNDVDMVVISHFHGDHINGLLAADGKPAFPNAEVLVPTAEWKYFMDDGEMSRQTTPRMKGVFANARKVFDALGRKVTPYDSGKEIVPGIVSMATYGHTPGHNSFLVTSGNAKLFVQADVTNIPLFVRHPDWHIAFDQDPNMAEATRRKIYDMLVAENMMVQAFHYPFPALARIEKTTGGYRETLVPWSPTL